MLRFRNPSSNLTTQIHILQVLYRKLGAKAHFGWEEMAEIVVTESSLMTAYGYSGVKAASISSQKKTSENSVKMNAKMMAEVFRVYGWVAPVNKESSYPIRFTTVGLCAATNETGAYELIKQAALGFVSPNENMSRVKSKDVVRFFPFALRTMRDMGGFLHKHELCIGPMSTDDNCQEKYDQMLEQLSANRPNMGNLKESFKQFCKEQGMTTTSVDNLTRTPISILRTAGWVESVRTKAVFTNSQLCLKITDEGIEQLNNLDLMLDFRLRDYRQAAAHEKEPLIRVGLFSMLQRAGYLLSDKQSDQLEEDKQQIAHILGGKELLFSPYQTISADEVDQALGIDLKTEAYSESGVKAQSIQFSVPEFELGETITDHDLESAEGLAPLRKSAQELYTHLESVLSEKKSKDAAVSTLFRSYRILKQDSFYPLIADLFSIIGFPCKESRAGDNGARWDAIVADAVDTIPIEIKSPMEEEYLSLKAVRQALENKVILLSRQHHPTRRETTSLAVGYHLPNSRAEVSTLIDYFYNSYQVRIGLIGLETLLELAIEAVSSKRQPHRTAISELKGVLRNEI